MNDLAELVALRASARFIIDTCDTGDVTRQKSEIVKEASSILTRVNQAFEDLVKSTGVDEIQYFIWSAEHQAWWKADLNGYAKGLNDAGKYDRDEALRICRNAIPTAGHLGCMSEMPVRCSDVAAFLRGQSIIPAALFKGERR